jgi:6-pyruvoyltetrahydropterin/6-carboxytetrahydropterin synthase
MPRVSLTRRVMFSAAHRYRRPEWPNAKNDEVFGKCARESFHGHTYICDVTVSGPLDETTGFVAHLDALDAILRSRVVDVLDHSNINVDVPEFAEGRAIPTGENLARWIAERVGAELPAPAQVTRVVVREEPSLWATWERD